MTDFLLRGPDGQYYVFIDSMGMAFTPVEVAYTSDKIDWQDAAPAARRGWWIGPKDLYPTHVRVRSAPREEVARYRLLEGIAPSDGFPETLTPSERAARVFDENGDVLDERFAALYVAEREPVAPHEAIIAVHEMVVLEGAPEPDDGLTWQANLPFELRHHREYVHLFPGEFLDDFQQVVHDEIEKLPGVKHCYEPRIHQRGRFLETVIAVPFDPPQTTKRHSIDRRRKPKTVERTVDIKVQVTVPHRVGGETRAAAKRSWDRLLADALEEVRSASVVACGHCDGRGFLERGAFEETRNVV